MTRKLKDIPWRSWMVLFGSFYIGFNVDGYILAYGVLKLEIEKEYPNVATPLVAAIIGLVPFLYSLLGPVCMAVISVVPLRTTVLIGSVISVAGFLLSFANYYMHGGFVVDLVALGILQGLGAALQFNPSFVVVTRHFHDRNGFAAGVITCGSPAGALFFGAVFKLMLTVTPFGWRGATLFFAGFSTITILPAIFFADPPLKTDLMLAEETSKKTSVSEQQESAWIKIWKSFTGQFTTEIWNCSFFTIVIMTSFALMGYYIPTLLVTGQADDPSFGVSKPVRDNLVFVWGSAHLVGRLVSGRLSDLGPRWKVLSTFSLYIIGLLTCAVALIFFPFAMKFGDVAFLLFAIIYGLFSAPFIALEIKLIKEIYFEKQAIFEAAWGWFVLCNSPVMIAGFVVSTFFNEITPFYAYLFGAGCFIMAAACLATLYKAYFAAYEKRSQATSGNEQNT